MHRLGRVGLLAFGAGSALLAGCQRSPRAVAPPPPPSAVTVTPGADGVETVQVTEAGANRYRFVPDTITATAGKIRITFRNTDVVPHNLTFSTLSAGSSRVATPTLRGGGEQSIEFTVSTPGTYGFVCTLHQGLGQVGTLTVRR
jgi:plastocyanin